MSGRVTEGWSDCSLRVTARACEGDIFTLPCRACHHVGYERCILDCVKFSGKFWLILAQQSFMSCKKTGV